MCNLYALSLYYKSALSTLLGLNLTLTYCVSLSRLSRLRIDPLLQLDGNCRSAYIVGVPRTFFGWINSSSFSFSWCIYEEFLLFFKNIDVLLCLFWVYIVDDVGVLLWRSRCCLNLLVMVVSVLFTDGGQVTNKFYLFSPPTISFPEAGNGKLEIFKSNVYCKFFYLLPKCQLLEYVSIRVMVCMMNRFLKKKWWHLGYLPSQFRYLN